MVVTVGSLGILGLESYFVKIEADISRGMSAFDIVGLPDASVKESRDRVRAALKNSGFNFPLTRITINLAPADIRKEGAVYDLPILVAILKASGQLNGDLEDYAFIGELSLSGEIRGINGVLPMTIKAKQENIKNLFVPFQNASESSIVEGINVYPVKNVLELWNHLNGKNLIEPKKFSRQDTASAHTEPDFSQVRGQLEVKRALEIAAAGGHNVLLIGTPGSGKSMLAKRMPSILPYMTFEESIETTMIYSIAGILKDGEAFSVKRPFRSPHHTVSPAGLSGGGTIPRPGEISLAHNGVLFLDELPEFSRSAIEVLRQPLEEGIVTISRASGTLRYPCSIMLIAAMNPCPCGYYNHPVKKCICSPNKIRQYLNKISGPLLDRMDIHIEVPPVNYEELSSGESGESSAQIKERVNRARQIQLDRYKNTAISCNAKLTAGLFQEVCAIDSKANKLLKKSFDLLGLSARAYDRILKVSRTIADLEGSDNITSDHILEAIQYRSLDRKYWHLK